MWLSEASHWTKNLTVPGYKTRNVVMTPSPLLVFSEVRPAVKSKTRAVRL